MDVLTDCAHELFEVAPLVVNATRAYMRDEGPGDLTISQFRALAFVDRHGGASLSELASHLGFQLPSVSRLVDGLVEQGLLTREQRPDNRRCVSLAATPRGHELSAAQLAFAEQYLAGRLASLPEAQQVEILHSLRILRSLFARQRPSSGADGEPAASDAAGCGGPAPAKLPSPPTEAASNR